LGAADATDGSIAGPGTFVAGIVHLIAPAADLMPLRVLDPYGAGDPALVAEAIREADDNGANVIVLGFVADTSSAAIVDAIHDATADGVLVVAPAGDSGAQGVWAQADDACTIGVVALAPLHVKASFASFGLKAGMSAPGESIVSTLPDPDHPGDETYGTWSGSSFAAPFVAGQAALIRSLDPTLGPRAVSAVIATTATGIDLLNPLFAGLLGAGAPHVTRSAYYLHDGHSPDLGDALISAACADG
jgi:subtilisin family serine protease